MTNHNVCYSASEPVPANVADIRGKKFQSNNTIGVNFHKDDGGFGGYNAVGFACLGYEVSNPQSYQYNYTSDTNASTSGNNITATAIGDLNGDSVYSTFQLVGSVQSKALTLAPSIAETNPDE
jgi:type IV pilus assembly protein PilA